MLHDTQITRSKYSHDDRMRALGEYAIHGTCTQVEKYTGIPNQTVNDWTKQEWWIAELKIVRELNKTAIESKYEQIVLKGLDAQLDRLNKGDPYMTKATDDDGVTTDVVAYKPVAYRDLVVGSGIGFDKMRLIRNEPTSIKAESTDARLDNLAQKVRELQGGMVTIEQDPADNTPK